jgi:methylated-DNA-[protein]-cysteine S-methyltransferase
MDRVELGVMASPIGPLTIAAHSGRVCLVHFGSPSAGIRRSLAAWYPDQSIEEHANPAGAATILERYFAGDLKSLDQIEVELFGTPFQTRVWRTLRTVVAGTTASYAELARKVGSASAVRAVGAANGANPVAVVLPCHRIIGSNGSLTGYGGGLERKRWLLDHEGVRRSLLPSAPREVVVEDL